MISIIIPVHNEESTLVTLYEKIERVISNEKISDYEVIFVDDGSRDLSWQHITELSQSHSHVKAIRFRRNFGKAKALSAGFSYSKGDVIITLDADLQDDPLDIPQFLKKIDEGFDLVSGWKIKRKDPLSKTLPSKLFNKITALVSGIELHDFNCGFKAYRRNVLKSIRIYGELHRYIPIMAHTQGFRIGETGIIHHPRLHGKSKYGWERFMGGFLDLLTVIATTKYLHKPGHLFGGIGIFFGVSGISILSYLSLLWLVGLGPIGGRPLLLFGVMMTIMSVQFISLGLLSELFIKNFEESKIETHISESLGLDGSKH